MRGVFAKVFSIATNKGYFNNQAGANPGFSGYPAQVLDAFNEKDVYDGKTAVTSEVSWQFLTGRIDADQPVFLSFQSLDHDDEDTADNDFVYTYHATVAFGYNRIGCYSEDDYNLFDFVKVFDG